MGKTSHERHVHFNYPPELLEMWKDQPEHLKSFLNEYATQYGYTGINLFYSLVWIYTIKKLTGEQPKQYYRVQI